MEVDCYDKSFIETLTEEQRESYTELRCTTTSAEFYRILDRTVTDCGFTLSQVSEAINRAYQVKDAASKQREKAFRVMHEILLPIFIAMRKKGCNNFDLRG